MKTLDEVIKANECCDHCEPDSRCEDCPYNGIGACALERETDALQWLKGYKVHIELDKLRDKYGVTSQKLRNTSQITCPKCHCWWPVRWAPMCCGATACLPRAC